MPEVPAFPLAFAVLRSGEPQSAALRRLRLGDRGHRNGGDVQVRAANT